MLDWINSLILNICLYHIVLATRLGHWRAYDSWDDVLQMVAPMVGYRAISPGGWVGNSTRVGFKFFTISDIRPVLVDLRLGGFGTQTGFASSFLQFPAKVQMASSPVRGMTPLLRQTYLMSLKRSRGLFKYFCSMTAIIRENRFFGSNICLFTWCQIFYNCGKGSDEVTGSAGQNLPWIWGCAPMKRGWLLEVANTKSGFGGPVYKNGIRVFTFTLFFFITTSIDAWLNKLIDT